MPKMKISVPHKLNQEDAKSRVMNLIGSLKGQFGSQVSNVQENWNGNNGNFSFSAMGMSVKGLISVGSNEVNLEGDLPIAALPFKGTIENTIKDKLSAMLS